MKKIFLSIVFFSCLGLLASCKEEVTSVTTSSVAPRTRTYYIAAEETEWDFAPSGRNLFMGMDFDAGDSQYVIHMPTGETPRIGRKCKKAHYVEYTDASFSTVKPRTADWEHLGILGPNIRAVVGDSVVVYFKNNTTIRTTIHVHGLEYDQASEGAPYNNGPAGNGNDVPPGGQFMYKYFARASSGPAPGQQSSLVWLYHSHVFMDERDIFAGLVGTVIVTSRDKAREDATPNDVDREFVTFFMIFNEANSIYQDENIETYLPGFTNPNP
ncbi:MAG: multicopper oxidase domain-containing protein, partial [Ignavibacteriota bacterium]